MDRIGEIDSERDANFAKYWAAARFDGTGGGIELEWVGDLAHQCPGVFLSRNPAVSLGRKEGETAGFFRKLLRLEVGLGEQLIPLAVIPLVSSIGNCLIYRFVSQHRGLQIVINDLL